MMYVFLLGGLFLGWSFGRNNLSNVFGTAIGTRMVPFRLAASLAGLFILMGALFSSSETTESMKALADISSVFGAFLISISIALTILLASRFGIPVSIAQSSVGALVGWNIFFHVKNDWNTLTEMISAWFTCPLMAAVLAIFGFYGMRFLLKRIPIPLLYRDMWVRFLLILSGVYSSYFLGANNIPAIAGPYLNIETVSPYWIIFLIGLAIAVGALMADKRVIATVSSGLFPLSPMEALVVVCACGMTLYCFSAKGLEAMLMSLNLPTFPLVPIPTSSVLVGSIIGVGLAKGHAGIHWQALGRIFTSWFLVPIISGLICNVILAILIQMGANL